MSRKLAVAMAAVIGLVMGATGSMWAQDEDEGPMSNMRFVVVRDANGKPVKNAAVVLHPVTKKGKQAMGGMELKTGEDGKAGIDGIPYGPLRVQVVAPGFQTFGEDYVVNQAETQITIKLKRPTKQYTSYGVQEAKKPDDKKAGDSQAAGKKPDDAKPQ
ncbi:MAG: carboxypeptidase-like regulatory domain-containing protein [Terriglobales bacterium]